ncbi:MAG: 23S rRNA (uracil-5-)-methyltransferase RumA, partial [Ruminococcaceae bacterium]|nr:23S rRNA (uracil-5-)-methyltransferase RumA [Oscillospiraceae bacterium]
KIVPYMLKSGERPDVVILDPPRKGSDEITLQAIADAKPKKISYVSCNPSTLARDIKFLSELGYKLEKVSGVDMFPHTSHVESVALLSFK